MKFGNTGADLYLTIQVQGLWKLFCTLELPLIKVLAGMKVQSKIRLLAIFMQLFIILK